MGNGKWEMGNGEWLFYKKAILKPEPLFYLI